MIDDEPNGAVEWSAASGWISVTRAEDTRINCWAGGGVWSNAMKPETPAAEAKSIRSLATVFRRRLVDIGDSSVEGMNSPYD